MDDYCTSLDATNAGQMVQSSNGQLCLHHDIAAVHEQTVSISGLQELTSGVAKRAFN